MAWSSSWRCELLLSKYTNRRSTVKYQSVASAEGRSLKELTKARPEFVEQDSTPVVRGLSGVLRPVQGDLESHVVNNTGNPGARGLVDFMRSTLIDGHTHER